VQVQLDGAHLDIKGKLGELQHRTPPELEVALEEEPRQLVVKRRSNDRRARSLHGLHRSLIANKVTGVTDGFSKKLEIHGTGYSIKQQGNKVVLQIGFCHPVTFELPEDISVEIEQDSAQADRPARFAVKGIDKEQVGRVAAKIRASRPPEPYKGKGIRYEGEYVRRKEGKVFAGLER
jgi:large subunit ribosomal protein L6